MNGHIIINFTQPGDWGQFRLKAIWYEQNGFQHIDRYRPEDLPAGYATAMGSVVQALVALGEPWQAQQVIARYGSEWVAPYPESETQFEPYKLEWVELEVEAKHDNGSRRSFSSRDYPALRVAAPEAVEAFKHFANMNF